MLRFFFKRRSTNRQLPLKTLNASRPSELLYFFFFVCVFFQGAGDLFFSRTFSYVAGWCLRFNLKTHTMNNRMTNYKHYVRRIIMYYIMYSHQILFDGVGGSGCVGWDRHRGWAEVHDRVEERRGKRRD